MLSGGGIGGLCLAVALSQFPDIDISIYEAAQSFKEVGAGVMIWGRTWRVLELLGLDTALREVAGVAMNGSEGVSYAHIMYRILILRETLRLDSTFGEATNRPKHIGFAC